jgi:guanylate kinase
VAKVFVITGPSGVGKGTLIRGLLERVPELELSVSATTRAPRPGEVDAVDYHFLTPAEFERRAAAGDFVEHAT